MQFFITSRLKKLINKYLKMKFLSIIDILGGIPNFNFNGKKKVSNSFTRILSLILIISTIFIGIILSSDFINRSNPQISQFSQYKSNKINNFNIDKRFYIFRINENGEFNDYFKILLEFIYSDGKISKRKSFEFEKCTNKHYEAYKSEKDFYEKIKKLKIDQYFCLPLNLTIPKHININEYDQNSMMISIFPLNKTYFKDKKIENIDLNIYFDNFNLKIGKYFSVERVLLNYNMKFSVNNLSICNLYFNENIVSEDIGIFTNFDKNSNYFIQDHYKFLDSNLVENNKKTVLNNKYGIPLFTLFYIVNYNEKITRLRYMKFQEYFAQIFSIFNLLYYLCIILSNIIVKIKIKLVLINKLFNSNDCEDIYKKEEPSFEINKKNVKTSGKFKLKEEEIHLKKIEKSNLIGNYEMLKTKFNNQTTDKLFSFWKYIKYWIFKRNKQKYDIIKEKCDLIERKLDITYILEKLEEIDLLKIILFNKYDLKLMKFIPKQNLYNFQNKIQKLYSIIDNKNKMLDKKEFDKCMKNKFKVNKKILKLIEL